MKFLMEVELDIPGMDWRDPISYANHIDHLAQAIVEGINKSHFAIILPGHMKIGASDPAPMAEAWLSSVTIYPKARCIGLGID